MGLGLEELDKGRADAVARPGRRRARGDSGEGVGVVSGARRGGLRGGGERGRDGLVGEHGVDKAGRGRECLTDPLGGRREREGGGQGAGDGGVCRREGGRSLSDERRSCFGLGLQRREELLQRGERLLGVGGIDVALAGDRLDESRGGGEGLGGKEGPGLVDRGAVARQGGDDGLEADGGRGRGAGRDEDGVLGWCVFAGVF